MTPFGFQLVSLEATGPHQEPAVVRFTAGLNVISGLSDTGKSYIFECINFMLGGSNIPKPIPESQSYNNLSLGLKDHSRNTYTLSRSLTGGKLKLTSPASNEREASVIQLTTARPKNAEQTLSHFLLGLTGLSGKRIRKNARNETQHLSFRALAHLVLVDEERIISKKSPVLSGEKMAETANKSLLRLVITGNDDSSLDAIPDKKLRRAALSAQATTYDYLIEQTTKELDALKGAFSNDENTATAITSKLNDLSARVARTSEQLRALTEQKRSSTEQLYAHQSRIIVLNELLSRFNLLREQYTSDLERLHFVHEGHHYFAQLAATTCPTCGQTIPGEQPHRHTTGESQDDSIQAAVRGEQEKIRVLISDLDGTVTALKLEHASVTQAEMESTQALHQVDTKIKTELEPTLVLESGELGRLLQAQDKQSRISSLEHQINQFKTARSNINTDSPSSKSAPLGWNSADQQKLQDLSDIILVLLKSWRFPDARSVKIYPPAFELFINETPASHHGKGYRAILNSAFTIGLMQYCAKMKLPHPGFVVLDSPLTTLKGPKALDASRDGGEEIPEEVQRSFFRALADEVSESQVIVLDNKEPDEGTTRRINYIHFSGSGHVGRPGFFPEQ